MSLSVRQAVILCGGLGTRLGGLTRDTPKPLLPVDGTPFLQFLMQDITRYGIDRFLLLAAYKADQFESFASKISQALGRPIVVEVAVEPDQAGTGGALFHAREKLDDAFFLFNGDTLLDVSLDLLAQKLESSNATGCLALRFVSDASRYGVVDVSGDRVLEFGRPPRLGEAAWINGGVAALRRSFVDLLGPQGAFETQALPTLAQRGSLAAVKSHGFFIDIGVPSDFDRGQIEIPEYMRRPAVFFDLGAFITDDNGSSAQAEWIAGVREAIEMVKSKGFYAFAVSFTSTARAAPHSGCKAAQIAELGARFDDERLGRSDCDFCAVGRENAPGLASNILSLMSVWPIDGVRSALITTQTVDLRGLEAATGIEPCVLMPGEAPDHLVSELLDRLSRCE